MEMGIRMRRKRSLSEYMLLCLAAFFMICLTVPPITGHAAAPVRLEDGEYSIDVKLEGGSGRATISSPAVLVVKNGCAYAKIEWSSSHYDDMKVEGEKYYPIEGMENSTFEIPVTAFDTPVAVIGDTTAMSMPHEVEYTLTFYEDSVISADASAWNMEKTFCLIVAILMAGAAVYIIFRLVQKRGKKSGK